MLDVYKYKQIIPPSTYSTPLHEVHELASHDQPQLAYQDIVHKGKKALQIKMQNMF